MPPSKITRMERYEAVWPKPGDVAALARLYGASDSLREHLEALARDTRVTGWWREYSDAFRGVLPDLEAEASYIHSFNAPFVPGLLQTEAYAEAVFRGFGRVGDDLARRVSARMERQKILKKESPPQLGIVLDESVARKTIGSPQVMADQLKHLCEVALWPHISIQMVLDEQGVNGALSGPFTVLGFPADPPVIYLETAVSSLVVESPDAVARYEEIYDRIKGQSLGADETVGFLSGMVGGFSAR